jgi:hypothetical protein
MYGILKTLADLRPTCVRVNALEDRSFSRTGVSLKPKDRARLIGSMNLILVYVIVRKCFIGPPFAEEAI